MARKYLNSTQGDKKDENEISGGDNFLYKDLEVMHLRIEKNHHFLLDKLKPRIHPLSLSTFKKQNFPWHNFNIVCNS